MAYNSAASGQALSGKKVIINEIMASSEGGEADYVEIYNATDNDIDMAGMILAYTPKNGKRKAITLCEERTIISRHAYFVLSNAPEEVAARHRIQNPEALAKPPKMPTLAANGTLTLSDRHGTRLDSVTYSEAWHNATLARHTDVALERVAANGASNDPANWTSALPSAGFGTPTAKNSVSVNEMSMSGKTRLRLRSKLIIPDGGGLLAPERMEVEMRAASGTRAVSMTIYDASGRRMATPYDNAPASSEEQTLIWDGRGDSGSPLTPGTYAVVVETWGADGRSERRKESVTVGRAE